MRCWGIYSDEYTPPSSSGTARCVRFSDGTLIEYEAKSSTLKVDGAVSVIINNAKTITANASTKIFLNSPVVECADSLIAKSLSITGDGKSKGESVIKGNFKHTDGWFSSNGIVVDKHNHSGVKSGSDNSGGPV